MATGLSPDLQEATQSLIENLLASEAFIRYRKAETRLNTDREARSLLERLSQAQARLRQNQTRGAVSQAEIDELRDLQAQVQRNRVIMEYAQAQQEAVYFLREINNEISALLGVNFATFANHATC